MVQTCSYIHSEGRKLCSYTQFQLMVFSPNHIWLDGAKMLSHWLYDFRMVGLIKQPATKNALKQNGIKAADKGHSKLTVNCNVKKASKHLPLKLQLSPILFEVILACFHINVFSIIVRKLMIMLEKSVKKITCFSVVFRMF